MSEIIVSATKTLTIAGREANHIVAKFVFERYQARKSANTLKGQRNALESFSAYLAVLGYAVSGEGLYTLPGAWEGVTFGLVEGFVKWLENEGFAVATINAKLTHVKTYCKLAAQAQVVDVREMALIKSISGYSSREAVNLDTKRTKNGTPTRKSSKKADATPLTPAQADQLMSSQPDTPQGRRDALLMALLLEHGLRVSEIEALTPTAISGQLLTFYQPKTNKRQKHHLTEISAKAVTRYLAVDGAAPDGLLRGSRKGGALTGFAMKSRAIRKRVGLLGERVGVVGLSPHDCRHAWATFAVNAGTGIKQLQDAGGWNSPAMPLRYAASAEIANAGVRLRR